MARALMLGFALILVFALGCSRSVTYSEAQKTDGFCSAPVETSLGKIKGVLDQSGRNCSWHGIPYAAPPVEELRWRAPQPAQPWEGVRDGSLWGHRCMQWDTFTLNFFNADPSGDMSEDCLYLNVWRPKKEGEFPVMFFIHGGGYGMGTGNTPTYWGDRLAGDSEVVVVTINYRLGYLGYLALPALSREDPDQSTGNYGTLDQIAALKWAKTNIQAFGGDPDNVTIFGQSAGGWSVCTLIASPLALGLFERAIMESGGCGQSQSLARGFQTGKTFAEKFNCKPEDLSCLRKTPATRIVKSSPYPTFTTFTYGPHEDMHVLSATPLVMIQNGYFNQVPVIFGVNRDEMTPNVLSTYRKYRKTPPEQYEDMVTKVLGMPSPEVKAAVAKYPLGVYQDQPINALAKMVTDFAFNCPTMAGLSAISGQEINAYRYRFDYSNFRMYAKPQIAGHGMELPFVFNSFDRMIFSVFFNRKQARAAEPLSKAMQAYWTNFAKTGNPNSEGLFPWPQFSAALQETQVLNATVGTMQEDVTGRCQYWKDHPTHLNW